jgi:peroxiredoxin
MIREGAEAMIEAGERLPDVTLLESPGYDAESRCPVSPQPVALSAITQGKTVVLFGVPGAFTRTCSARHLPEYLAAYDEFRARGVDAIVCVSMNDAYVMSAWGRDQLVGDRIRMLGDGGELTKRLGLETDLTGKGMGVRCRRFSMLVVDGVVRTINVEEAGRFAVSDAQTMLRQIAA